MISYFEFNILYISILLCFVEKEKIVQEIFLLL